ncbi:MAG: lysozyme [Alphaproteobacteria bacterium]|nr:lysozyme [Alphaproteobacteria bacterium]
MDKIMGAGDALAASRILARKINQDGIDIIKKFEGLHLVPYRCPGKIWTIGYGHTRTVRSGMKISVDQADLLLADDMRRAEAAVLKFVRVPLNDNQFSALVSFVFNVGTENFEKSSLLKLLNRGWYEQVPAQLMRWNRASGEVLGGLTRRRAAEGKLWSASCVPSLNLNDNEREA